MGVHAKYLINMWGIHALVSYCAPDCGRNRHNIIIGSSKINGANCFATVEQGRSQNLGKGPRLKVLEPPLSVQVHVYQPLLSV